MDKVSIIIPCYFADERFVEMTGNCLDTLSGVDEVIIVDDGSPVTPVYGEEYIYVSRLENGGYAAAVNTGLKEATGEVIVVCNNDIEFIQPDWLKHLLKPLKEGYDIASIRTTDADGWETDDYISEDDKFGSIWAMKREVYETIGGLDETFGKGYFEDLDYHHRAKREGFRVAKNHAGLVEHKGKATFKEVDPDDTSFLTARDRFIAKWGKVW